MLTLIREGGRWWLIADQFSPLPGDVTGDVAGDAMGDVT
jgi:hypothetical protein